VSRRVSRHRRTYRLTERGKQVLYEYRRLFDQLQ
jgi:DNA-binding PadR family transcriptional regulator